MRDRSQPFSAPQASEVPQITPPLPDEGRLESIDDPTPAPQPSKRNRWSLIFSLVLFGLILSVLWDLTKAIQGGDMTTFRDMLSEMRPGYLVAALALYGGMIAVDGQKFSVISRAMGYGRRAGRDLRTAIFGKFYDNISPYSSAGEPMQVYHMTRAGIPAGSSTAITIIKFFAQMVAWITTATIVMIALAGSLQTIEDETARKVIAIGAWMGLVINIVGPSTIVFIAFRPRAARRVTEFFLTVGARIHLVKDVARSRAALAESVQEFETGTQVLKRMPTLFWRLLGLTIVEPIVMLSLPYLLIVGLGGNDIAPSLTLYWTTVGLTMYATYSVVCIPTPSNAGAAETVFLLAFSGITPNVLFWLVLVWRFFTCYGYVLMGVGLSAWDIMTQMKQRKRRVPSKGVGAAGGKTI